MVPLIIFFNFFLEMLMTIIYMPLEECPSPLLLLLALLYSVTADNEGSGWLLS